MPVLTLKEVTGTHDWSNKHGAMVDITLLFDDGTKAFVTTKPDTLAKRRAELEATLGVPGEWTLEDKGKWDDGRPKPSKVTDYPGKPQKGGPDGGGGKSWYNSEEGVRFTQERTDRRTALMQAMTAAEIVARNNGEPSDTPVLPLADEFYTWLRQTAGAPSEGGHSSSRAPAPPSPAPADPAASSQGASSDTAGPTPEGVQAPSGAGDPCIHPVESRRQTASGRWRCGVCRLFLEDVVA